FIRLLLLSVHHDKLLAVLQHPIPHALTIGTEVRPSSNTVVSLSLHVIHHDQPLTRTLDPIRHPLAVRTEDESACQNPVILLFLPPIRPGDPVSPALGHIRHAWAAGTEDKATVFRNRVVFLPLHSIYHGTDPAVKDRYIGCSFSVGAQRNTLCDRAGNQLPQR